MIENYIYKKESNPNTFWYEDRKGWEFEQRE